MTSFDAKPISDFVRYAKQIFGSHVRPDGGIWMWTWTARSELFPMTNKPMTPYKRNETTMYIWSISPEKRTKEQNKWLSKFKWISTDGFHDKSGRKLYLLSNVSVLSAICGGTIVDNTPVPKLFHNRLIHGAVLTGPDLTRTDHERGDKCREFAMEWARNIIDLTDPNEQDLMDLIMLVDKKELTVRDIDRRAHV